MNGPCLPPADVALFYKLTSLLYLYVNAKMGIGPGFDTVAAQYDAPTEQRIKIRDALWNNSALLDEFAVANPHNLSPEELEIVRGWRKFVKGPFHIVRHLSQYTVFMQGRVGYAVIGMTDPFDRLIPREHLPAYVMVVLLPFKGRIVYDGFLQKYSMSFGRTLAAGIREDYLAAKQNGRIIMSLDGETQKGATAVKAVDWTAQADAALRTVKALGRGGEVSAVQRAVFNLARVATEMAHIAAGAGEDRAALQKQNRRVYHAWNRVCTIMDRASGK